MSSEGPMFFGVQYYRPRHPAPEYWESDFRQIRASGFDRIRIWLLWSDVQADPDRWDFSTYDRLIDLAAEAGLDVLIQVMPESAPYWVNRIRPEWLIRDIAGKPLHLCGESSLMSGSFPGVSWFVPEAEAACGRFLEETARHYAGRPNLWAWDAWNELYREDDYGEAALEDWRRWLLGRYGSAEGLADKWRRPVTDVRDLFFPPDEFTHTRGTWAGSTLERLDLSRWRFDAINRQMDWRVENLRRGDPDHPIVAHSHGSVTTRMDPWEVGKRVDIWGASSHDVAGPWITRNCDFTRASAPKGGWFLSEMSSGSIFFGFGHAKRTYVELRDQPIWGWAFGAAGVLYWQWRPEVFGHEATQFGMTDLAGGSSLRVEAVRDSMAFFRNNESLLKGVRWDPPNAGILWDPDSQALPGLCKGAGDPALAEQQWQQWYAGLWQAGLHVTGLHAPTLAAGGIPESVRLIVAPMQFMTHPGLEDALSRWIERGGTLLAGPAFLWWDNDALLRPWPATTGDLRAFASDWEFPTDEAGRGDAADEELSRFREARQGGGGKTEMPTAASQHQIVWDKGLRLPVDRGPIYALKREGAAPIAFWRERPVALRQSLGKGVIYHFGAWRTAGSVAEPNQPWQRLTMDLAAKAGARPPIGSDGRTWLRRATTRDGSRLLVVFNATDTAVACRLSSAAAARNTRSLKSGLRGGPLGKGHDLRLELAAHEVEVMLC